MAKFIKVLLWLFWFTPAAAFSATSLVLSWLSLDEVTKQIRQNGDKRVLGAKTETIDGREVHVIKVLTSDGRIQYLRIDAETGKPLGGNR